jgi:gluconokinase
MASLILSLDIGTSSCRTAFFDETGRRILDSTAQKNYPLWTTSDGGAELDPQLLLEAVRQCLAQTLGCARSSRALRGFKVRGIGVSCFWHSLIGTNAGGEPLTKVITWADARCREDAARLRETFSEKVVHARTGCMLRSSFWPAKLLWLRRTQVSLFRRVRCWMSPAEWLQHQLAGANRCALGMATGTGLFNPTKLAWDGALLEHCGLSASQLPELSDDPVYTSGVLASEFAELSGVPWFPAIGDGAASNLGSDCTRPGLAAINVGTSAALRIMRAGKVAKAPAGLFCYRVDADRYLVGGAVSNAGNLRAWCLKELNVGDPQTLEAELSKRSTPDHGLTVLPFWTAERAPTWNEDLRGAILGITQATSAVDLLQAITEATFHRIAQIAEALSGQDATAPKYLVSGGIQHSKSALQRLADVLDQPLHANPEPEASIRGAAVFTMEKLGMPIAPLPIVAPLRPRKSIAQRYAQDRERQASLERLLKSFNTTGGRKPKSEK